MTYLAVLQIPLLQDSLDALLLVLRAELVLKRSLRCAIVLSLSPVPAIAHTSASAFPQGRGLEKWGDFGKLRNGTHLCVMKIWKELTTCARGTLLSFLHFRTSSALSAKTMKSSSLPLK